MTTTAMNETPMGASPQGGKLAGRKASMSALAKRAVIDSFAKLTPREQAKNPVMLMVYISAILTLGLFALSLFGIADAHPGFIFAVSAVLWLTVLFANFAEALAEGRGKAQADSLRAAKRDIDAHKLNEGLVAKGTHADDPAEFFRLNAEEVSSAVLKKKDLFFVTANEQIPADGVIVMGAASVDESAITGESAPVIREAGGDRSAVTGGTTVLSDWLVVRVTADAGHSFLDQMIAMVESAARKKTPNEIALEILLIALTIVFLVVSVSLFAFSRFGASQEGIANPTTIASLVALFVCLAPTTIGALLSAIGIAGMSRLNQANVLAMSGRAVEAAGDVDVLLLDKTGTITLGNRQAAEFIPVDGASEREVADAAQLASLTDETPEGRSIVVLAKELFDIRARVLEGAGMTTIPFTAQTRMSGVDFEGHEIRKGAADAVKSYVESCGGTYSAQCAAAVEHVSRAGGTPLLVARDHRILGVVYLKDIVKQGIKENFADLRTMGIKTAMNSGTQAAKEAGNMVDLDSSPTKLIDIVRIGKQLLMTRGSLTTFSIANDVAKYFAIIPALFVPLYPALEALNIMRLTSPTTAILAAVIYNALIIVALIPLALKGVKYREATSQSLLKRNLAVYGLGGIVLPFAAIKLLDMGLTALGVA